MTLPAPPAVAAPFSDDDGRPGSPPICGHEVAHDVDSMFIEQYFGALTAN